MLQRLIHLPEPKHKSANGISLIVIWECEVNKHFDVTMERLVKEIQRLP